MDKLLTPIEQAKKIGFLKAPEQMESEQKQHYVVFGIVITCAVILGGFLINHFVEKNKQKQKE